jgi:hypothetical protein
MSNKIYKLKYKILMKQIKMIHTARITTPQRQREKKETLEPELTSQEEGYNISMILSSYLLICPTPRIERQYDNAIINLLKIKQNQDNNDLLLNIYRSGIKLILYYIFSQVDDNLDKIDNKEHVKLILKFNKLNNKNICSLLKDYFYKIKIVGEEYLKKSKSPKI